MYKEIIQWLTGWTDFKVDLDNEVYPQDTVKENVECDIPKNIRQVTLDWMNEEMSRMHK